METLLSGINGDGFIALARYVKEPAGTVPFSDPVLSGGTGKPAIKFWDVYVEGIHQSTATVTGYFFSNETGAFNTNSLFLAYYYENKWYRCENSSISLDDNSVTGDIPIIRLNGTIVGLGGESSSQNAGGSLPAAQNNNNVASTGVSWSTLVVIAAPIIIIGGVAIIFVSRKRRNSVHKR